MSTSITPYLLIKGQEYVCMYILFARCCRRQPVSRTYPCIHLAQDKYSNDGFKSEKKKKKTGL